MAENQEPMDDGGELLAWVKANVQPNKVLEKAQAFLEEEMHSLVQWCEQEGFIEPAPVPETEHPVDATGAWKVESPPEREDIEAEFECDGSLYPYPREGNAIRLEVVYTISAIVYRVDGQLDGFDIVSVTPHRI